MIEQSTDLKEYSEEISIFSNDNYTAPVRMPLTGFQSAYYRSKLFNIDTHINPLISAASPLFAIASALKNTVPPVDIDQLYQDLCHEIKAFENRTQSYNYRSHIILAARYILCTLIDEIILKTVWGHKSFWQSKNLLNTFQRENWGGEKFFIILERSCEDPVIHIDLLEMFYITLSLGFEGKYQSSLNGHQELSELMDFLYDIIQQQRGEFSKKLFLQQVPSPQKKKLPYQIISISLILFVTIFSLLVIYLTLSYSIQKQTKYLYRDLNNLNQYSFNQTNSFH